MTRATWCAAAGDRGRTYRGAHRADTTRNGMIVRPRRQPQLARPLVVVGAMAAGLVLGVWELLADRPRIRWPRLDRGLPLALTVGAAWWLAVAVAAVLGGPWWAVGTALGGVYLLVMVALAVPAGRWRR